MTTIPIFALMLAPNPPLPLNETQMRDIACVATLALAVSERTDLAAPARRWSGLVGQRVMDESGQPRELVATAMIESANAQAKLADSVEARGQRVAQCEAIMYGELAAVDATSAQLPEPVKSE
jgi:hypothetical protein